MSKDEKEVLQNSQENQEDTSGNKEQEATPEPSPEDKIKELNDRYLRLYSEFDNYKKRTQRERIDLVKTAGEDIFRSFLPVIDDIERALKANDTAKDLKAVTEGLHLIHHKFSHSLRQKGLEPIDSMGKEFNVDLHEAVTNIPAPTDDLKGKVVDELEKGYTLNGKVIRFAKVVVGS
ncbi:MAG: nucleotide exchange factor GrpE [Bacteroidia bacterium]